MAERIKEKKRIPKKSHAYFAVKSQNELYYQMASIFKHTGRDEDVLAKKIIFTSLTRAGYEIPVNN